MLGKSCYIIINPSLIAIPSHQWARDKSERGLSLRQKLTNLQGQVVVQN